MENIEIFKKWMEYRLEKLSYHKKDNTYIIKSNYKNGEIVVWDNGLIEEYIRENGEITFYLFYQFSKYNYAVKMFNAFMEHYISMTKSFHHKVLLCCSGGMTTTYFKSQMEIYLKINHSNISVSAAAVDDVVYIADDYDLILVAPQMRYAQHSIQRLAPHSKVENIDPGVFARYDCAALYEQINDFYLKGDNND